MRDLLDRERNTLDLEMLLCYCCGMQLLSAVAAFLVALVLEAGSNWIALLRFPSEETHWTQRARKLYPIRRSARLNTWLIPAMCGIAYVLVTHDEELPMIIPLVLSAWVGAVIGTYPFTRRIFPQFSFKIWMRCVYGSWVMRFGILGALVLSGVIMPEEFGWPLVLIACVTIGLQVAIHFGFWLWIGKMTGLLVLAKESDPVSGIVRRTSEKMQVPYRKIWIMRNPVGYAAAFPTTHDLIFSEGLIALHPEDEIAAICAHELAHLSEPRRMVFARVAAAMSLCPLIFIRPMVHVWDFFGVVVLLVPLAIASQSVRRLRRRMEVRADAMANQNADEAGVYARALERLYCNNQIPAVMAGKRQVHPHLYDRLLAAGVTPDYPRPEPPAKLYWTSGLMYLVLVLLFVALLSVN